jgi:formylglycine-generating enzyme required for sulfatase activity
VAVAALALLWALPSRRLPADGQEPPVRQETPAPRPAEKVQSLAPPAALSAAGKSSKGYPRFFNEKDGSHLILIPAGPFRMGSDAPGSAKDEGPSLLVTLPDYLIGEKEVTWKQYARFCGATSRRLPARPAGAGEVHPVVGIRWADAVAYCDWAGFRLPTEAEWEKAARGTGGHVYPWGDEAPSEARACFDRLMVGQSEPVGSYPAGASPFGALDMAGNVWEWCADWYDPEAYRRAPRRDGVLAPKGPSSGKDRVVRGGSWFNQGETLRVSYRYGTRPDFGGPYYGFRVARTSP